MMQNFNDFVNILVLKKGNLLVININLLVAVPVLPPTSSSSAVEDRGEIQGVETVSAS